jgi:BolA protein
LRQTVQESLSGVKPLAADDSGIDFETLLRARLAGLDPLELELIDDSAKHAGHQGAKSGGGHYRLRIVSSAFCGKRTVARHRLVYEALGELMHGRIHALSIVSQSPDEVQ